MSSTAWDQPPMHAAVAAGIAAGLVLLSGSPAYANTVFEGPARIVDGDTLYIGACFTAVGCKVGGKGAEHWRGWQGKGATYGHPCP